MGVQNSYRYLTTQLEHSCNVSWTGEDCLLHLAHNWFTLVSHKLFYILLNLFRTANIIIIIIIIIIREVLCRIIGKTISAMFKEEVKEAAGPLQVCAGHRAGSEAAIHAMNQVFNEEGADGVLLIDGTNAFNQMNRAVTMHNIRITCKEIASYIINTYRSPSRLLISGGGEISS